MKKAFIIVCSLGILAACQTSRQAAIPASIRDTVYLVRVDTFIRSLPEMVLDATAPLDIKLDSFEWNTTDVQTVLVVERDTVWRYRIKTQIKPDTITLTRTDTIFKEVTKEVVSPAPGDGGGLPWWLFVIVAGVAALFGYQIKKQA